MIHQMSVQYPTCQTCQAKIHCDQCSRELEDRLLRMDEISRADLNLITKIITVETDLDADDLEAVLEDIGLFVD